MQRGDGRPCRRRGELLERAAAARSAARREVLAAAVVRSWPCCTPPSPTTVPATADSAAAWRGGQLCQRRLGAPSFISRAGDHGTSMAARQRAGLCGAELAAARALALVRGGAPQAASSCSAAWLRTYSSLAARAVGARASRGASLTGGGAQRAHLHATPCALVEAAGAGDWRVGGRDFCEVSTAPPSPPLCPLPSPLFFLFPCNTAQKLPKYSVK